MIFCPCWKSSWRKERGGQTSVGSREGGVYLFEQMESDNRTTRQIGSREEEISLEWCKGHGWMLNDEITKPIPYVYI